MIWFIAGIGIFGFLVLVVFPFVTYRATGEIIIPLGPLGPWIELPPPPLPPPPAPKFRPQGHL